MPTPCGQQTPVFSPAGRNHYHAAGASRSRNAFCRHQLPQQLPVSACLIPISHQDALSAIASTSMWCTAPPLPWRTEKPIPHFPPCYKILAAPLAIQSYVKSHRRVAKSNRSLLNSVDSLQQHERCSCQSPNNSVAI